MYFQMTDTILLRMVFGSIQSKNYICLRNYDLHVVIFIDKLQGNILKGKKRKSIQKQETNELGLKSFFTLRKSNFGKGNNLSSKLVEVFVI